eukprot:m.58416 g.58416  ORF g.58416 m.58416 type:complete len:185 (-) comp12864_c1_seq3:254-808(-)
MVRVRKVAIMGYPAVGKSSLAYQFVEGRFEEEYVTTIENRLTAKIDLQGREFELQLFDTLGLTELPNFSDEYLTMDGFIITFSVTSRKSFQVMEEIYHKLKDAFADAALPLVIVGNKTDMGTQRAVLKDEAEEFAQQAGATYIEASAKDNVNVRQAFHHVIYEMEKARGEPFKGSPQNKDCIIL